MQKNTPKRLFQLFFGKKITIEVFAIEDYLEALLQPNQQSAIQMMAQEVWDIYQVLTDESQSSGIAYIQNCVRMKDLFATFIISTQGGYVIDTNVRCKASFAQTCLPLPALDTFLFPVLYDRMGVLIQPEVWLLYAPMNYFNPTNNLCASYLYFYRNSNREEKRYVGPIAIKNIRYAIKNNFKIKELHCLMDEESQYVHTNIGLFKEYFNSHVTDLGYVYGIAEAHVYLGDYKKLQFDLEHGADPNTLIGKNPKPLIYLALHCLAKQRKKTYQDPELGHYEECLECLLQHGAAVNDQSQPESPLGLAVRINLASAILLLLSYGANPNAHFSYMGDDDQLHSYTPITYCLLLRSEKKLELLLNHSLIPVELTQLVDGKSLLIWAMEHHAGLKLLLEKGRDLNDAVWETQKQDALDYATEHSDEYVIELLKSSLADNPDQHSPIMRG